AKEVNLTKIIGFPNVEKELSGLKNYHFGTTSQNREMPNTTHAERPNDSWLGQSKRDDYKKERRLVAHLLKLTI
ncbi:hypothetical protein ACJX0J_027847, partial [Zea mays]